MKTKLVAVLLALFATLVTSARDKYNFNSDWLLKVGDIPAAQKPGYKDTDWKKITLPHAFNEDEAFRLDIHDLTDTVMWYRKHFVLPKNAKGRKVFIEFEGARFAADVFVNGKFVGTSENGVMAFGFDLTPYVKVGNNVISVRVDNDWSYKERESGSRFQWNDRNFNANYGGLPKNVWLHVTGKLYQTLPLYSNLKTTGVYVYAYGIRVKSRSATVHSESEISNETEKAQAAEYAVSIYDPSGRQIASFGSEPVIIPSGGIATLSAEKEVEGLHFWSWGYGYLYDVKTALKVDGEIVDEVTTRTGFRKTRFGDGKIWINDRVLQVKGFAQRTSNEWPALGMSVPAWLSDYSNAMMVEGNANTVRWMHVTPWKQDIESCDRVGLMMSMQAGDAEKDAKGRQWEQRKELMRDAIIYNRNNPSIIYYECGNESISREHMIEMREIRDRYDFYGGRAIGSREMLDIPEAEYGGEMLYINKSGRSPMWAMEYCRDEALRKYWDDWSYPFHKEGEGNNSFLSAASNTIQRNVDARPYNRNQDQFTVEHVRRWYDYFLERPGSGTRVSSGGVKIIFSDSNTHFRGVENYRRSGVTDPLRIPKDSYWAHQVMWDGWVDIENPRIYIVGHWNYPSETVKPVYVVSNTETVKLFLNGKEIPGAKQEYQFLFTYSDVAFEEGKLEAVGYNSGQEVARHAIETAGKPTAIKLTPIMDPQGWRADGADVALVEVEVVDARGRRCPLANDLIHYDLSGPAEWRGGIAQGPDNYILAKNFPVECGVNRTILRSTTTAGTVTLKASAEGLTSAEISLRTEPFKTEGGLSEYIPGDHLKGWLTRGETPPTPSYSERTVDVPIIGAVAGANSEKVANSFDDNELSEWTNDGNLRTGWITYQLGRMAEIDEICLKLTGWRMRSYPLEIYAGNKLIWAGETERSLGYVHLPVKPVTTREITVRLRGAAEVGDAFSGITEVVAPAGGELDLYKAREPDKASHELRIVEIEFKEHLD
jgi:beta-galactosidase